MKMNAFISSSAPLPMRSNGFVTKSSSLNTCSFVSSTSTRRLFSSVATKHNVHHRVATPTTMAFIPPTDTTVVTTAFSTLSENPGWLTTLANAVGTIPIPEAVKVYGHPALMAFMILGMGVPGAVFGWQGRLNEDKKKGVQQKQLHENVMIAFFLLAAFGGFGGTLSTAMQGYDVWQSPHAISALVVLLLLGANSVVAYSGFTIGNDGSPKGRLEGRKLHSYFGLAVLAAIAVHIFFGVQILLG